MSTPNYGKIEKPFNTNTPFILPCVENRNRWICASYKKMTIHNLDRINYVYVFVDNYCNIYNFLYHSMGSNQLWSRYDNNYKVINDHEPIYKQIVLEDTLLYSNPLTDKQIDALYYRLNEFEIRTTDEITHFIAINDSLYDLFKNLPKYNKEKENDEENDEEDDDEEEEEKSKYRSNKDAYEGLIDDYGLLTIKYEEGQEDKYKGYEVYASWNNWMEGYNLVQEQYEDTDDTIWSIGTEIDNLKAGKYHYKFKKDGVWIEPSENELREKDENGVWNNVLFVHYW